MDSFTREIKAFMEAGGSASMPDHAFRATIVKKVQVYSAGLELLSEKIPELFLHLTDLIVSGGLGKMPPDTLRAYLALIILTSGSISKRPSKTLAAELSELAGFRDETVLRKALDELKDLGYIDSPEVPVPKEVSSQKGRRSGDFGASPALSPKER
jgi:hypothetical protein